MQQSADCSSQCVGLRAAPSLPHCVGRPLIWAAFSPLSSHSGKADRPSFGGATGETNEKKEARIKMISCAHWTALGQSVELHLVLVD